MDKRVLLVAMLVILVGCGATPTPEPTVVSAPVVLTISGSGTTTAILTAVKPAFEADVPGYTLNILPGSGTDGGMKGVIAGTLDVVTTARPPKDSETAQGILYTQFGLSGVVFYTYKDLGVTSLTSEQAAGIFSGKITNWSQVGGPDRAIILYIREETEPDTIMLRQAVFGDTPFPATVAGVLNSQYEMQDAVSGTPDSIGYGSWPAALSTGAAVQGITLNGIAPADPANPIVAPIGIGYLGNRQADVQPLIDWLLSERGQAALKSFGVIPVP